MKLLFEILFLFLIWFTNLANATPVFAEVLLPSNELSFSKIENVKEKSVVKIGIQNFAGNSIENEFSSILKGEVRAAIEAGSWFKIIMAAGEIVFGPKAAANAIATATGVGMVISGTNTVIKVIGALDAISAATQTTILLSPIRSVFINQFGASGGDFIDELNEILGYYNLTSAGVNLLKLPQKLSKAQVFWKNNKAIAKNNNLVSPQEEKWIDDLLDGGSKAVTGVGRANWNGFANIFKANTDEILEATNRIKNHRLTAQSGGNYGYIEGTVNNASVDNKFWRSGAVQEGEPQIFTAIQVEGTNGGAWLRNTDSEYKMLNNLASDWVELQIQ